MAGSATLVLSIVADTRDAVRGLNDTENAAGKFKNTIGKLAVPAAAAVGGLLALGKAAADSASDQQQAFGALDSVYGPAAASVKAFANTAATAVGLSKTAYANASAAMGASLKSLGFDQAKAAESSAKMISLGADLAATFGGTAADAVEALGATLRGEYDSSEKYGLGLSAATVQAELAARGQDKLTGTALAAAKAQATLDIATKNAAGSTGQFARETGTAAGAQEIANAKYEDAKAALGEKLLPVIATLTGDLAKMADWISKNTVVVGILVGIVGGLAVGVLAVSAAMKVASAATKIWAAVNWVLNASLWANPITWIVAGVIALIAVIVLVATKTKFFQTVWDTAFKFISKIAQSVFNWIKTNWPLLVAIITGPIGIAVLLIVKNFDTIKAAASAVFDWLNGVFGPVFNIVKDIAVLAFQLIAINVLLIINGALIVFNFLKTVFMPIFNVVRDVAVAAFNVIKDVAVGAFNIISGAVNAVRDVAVGVYNWFRGVFATVFGFVKDAAVAALNAISGPFNTIKSTAETLYNWLKNTLNPVWDTIKTAASSALGLILAPINAITSAFNSVVAAVKSVIDWISKIKIPDLGGIVSKLNPLSKSAPAPAVANPAVARVGAFTAATGARAVPTGGGGGPTIIIQGAIDPRLHGEADPADPARRHPPPRRCRGGADMSTGTTATLYVDGERFADGSPGDDLTDPVALSGLTVVWGRDTTVDQPAPSTCSFTVADRAGGRSFLDLLHTGLSVDVTATGVDYPDPTVSTFLDPGFETDPIAATPQNATVGASTRRVHGGSRALQVLPVDGTRRWTVTLPPAPFVPAGTNPGVWDTIPQTEPGQTWQVGAWIWAPAGVSVTVRPVLFAGPGRVPGRPAGRPWPSWARAHGCWCPHRIKPRSPGRGSVSRCPRGPPARHGRTRPGRGPTRPAPGKTSPPSTLTMFRYLHRPPGHPGPCSSSPGASRTSPRPGTTPSAGRAWTWSPPTSPPTWPTATSATNPGPSSRWPTGSTASSTCPSTPSPPT